MGYFSQGILSFRNTVLYFDPFCTVLHCECKIISVLSRKGIARHFLCSWQNLLMKIKKKWEKPKIQWSIFHWYYFLQKKKKIYKLNKRLNLNIFFKINIVFSLAMVRSLIRLILIRLGFLRVVFSASASISILPPPSFIFQEELYTL